MATATAAETVRGLAAGALADHDWDAARALAWLRARAADASRDRDSRNRATMAAAMLAWRHEGGA